MHALALARRSLARAPRTATRLMSTMHDNDPQVLEREKRKNLAGTQQDSSPHHKTHAPGWNEHLASESEAHIKADKSTGTVDEIVKTTVDYVKRRHPNDSSSQSFETREEIEGPLGKSQNKNMTGSEEAVRADKT